MFTLRRAKAVRQRRQHRALADLLVTLKNSRKMEPAETLRLLEITLAMGLVRRESH